MTTEAMPGAAIFPKKIFINHADSFTSSFIAKALLTVPIGVQKIKDNEEDNIKEGGSTKTPPGFTNKLFCTLSVTDYKPSFPLTVVGNEAFCPVGPDFLPPSSILKESLWIDLYAKIKDCDYFIYNIIDDDKYIEEAVWMAHKLQEDMEGFAKRKVLVLVSTVLTWARTKQLVGDEEEIPFTDDDFRRRKAHINYEAHIQAEKEIKKIGMVNKLKFLTYVIACGASYGEEENIFHPFFKAGWLNAPFLEVFGSGRNVIPTIHVRDLASIVHQVLDVCPTKHYMLACDASKNTLKEIVKAISAQLTTGKIKHLALEQAFTLDDITQIRFDHLTVNLSLEPEFIEEAFNIKWVCQDGMVEAIKRMVKEYKMARGLLPLRLCVMGPPMTGKTILSRRMGTYFGVPHIHVKEVIETTIAELEKQNAPKPEEEETEKEVEEGEEAEEEDEPEDTSELLEEVKESLAENKGRLSNELLCRFIRKRLTSKPCLNQGYILDGFPKTKTQARAIFEPGEDEEEEEEEAEDEAEEEEQKEENGEAKGPVFDVAETAEAVRKIEEEHRERERSIINITAEPSTLTPISTRPPKGVLPVCCVFLQASDRFLIERTLQLPEEEVQGTHNTEDDFLRRLVAFRANQAGVEVASILANDDLRLALTPEQLQRLTAGKMHDPTHQLASISAGSVDGGSVYAFFEDKDVPLLTFDVMQEESQEFPQISRKLKICLGPPRNYGPSAAEVAQLQIQLEAVRLAKERSDNELEIARANEEMRKREFMKRELAEILKKVKNDEEMALLTASKPLRKYLSKFIMPTLTSGIFECIKLRPEDPIDFLAEYLFRNNPQID